jgi:hypothetical protein
MAFMDDAKDVLSADEFASLEKLAKKVSEFDTNSDEDKLFFDLKSKVKKSLGERDRAKNLAFLKDGGYSIVEILKAMGITREQFNDTKSELFPNTPKISETIAIYKALKNESGVATDYEFKMGGRMDKVLSDAIKKGKEKHFVANLTDFGKTWIAEVNIPTAGPYADKKIYKHVGDVVARIKSFSKDGLRKELNITE